MIIEAGQLELVEANVRDIVSCATHVVPELGEKGR
jgi:hypothetical protein